MSDEPITSPMRDAALYCAGLGSKVLPLHNPTPTGCSCSKGAACENIGKHPRTEHGKDDATDDEDQVRAWWQQWPDANIGVACAASGLLVLDVDPRNGGTEALADLERVHGQLPRTTEAVTGGDGRHLFFSHPGGSIPKTAGPGLDLISAGYIVAPPSLHASGQRYRWCQGAGPDECDWAAPPPWLLETAANGNKPSFPQAVAPVEGAILRGKRNDTLVSLAGSMRRRGMSAPAIEAALLADNRERCVPPLPEAEARAAAASVAKYEPARPDEARRANAEGVSRHLVSMTAENLLALPRQPREYVLEPFMRTKDTGMIAAERGVGKTWVSMGMASAIAAGGRFLDWTAPRPRPVLYVDGELPTETIQERLRQTREICGHDWEGRLAFLAADLQESSIPSLNSPEAQLMIEEHLGAAEVLFLDNLSCLCRGGVENEAESWEGMQAWILSLRRRGVAVFFDHHAGRSGKPRGTSKREDVLDIVISLKHPDDYVPEQGARFEVHFDKARGLYGTAVAAFEARLDIGGSLSPLKWVTRSLEGVLKERVLALHRDGMKQNDIAKAVERDKSRVSRILTKAKAAGEITPCP